MSDPVVAALLVNNTAGDTFIRFDAPEGSQFVMPRLLPPDGGLLDPFKYLHAKHVALSTEELCGSVHAAAHPSRAKFSDVSLWTEPALAPTALVPTLPETCDAAAGFEQLELEDEGLLERYPVLQAMRCGKRLDPVSYTRGSYQTVPVVPGATAWESQERKPVIEGAQSGQWLTEFLSDAPPSVPVMGLPPSHFTTAAAAGAADAPVAPAAEAAAPAFRPPQASPEPREDEKKLDLNTLFDGIYMGEDREDSPVGEPTAADEAMQGDEPTAEPLSGADNALRASFAMDSNASVRASSPRSESTQRSNNVFPQGSGPALSASQSFGGVSGLGSNVVAASPLGKRLISTLTQSVTLTAKNLEASGLSKQRNELPVTWDQPEENVEEDDEELRALEEEEGDAVPDLPVLDDLEIVLRASEPPPGTVPPRKAPSVALSVAATPGPQSQYQWAREKTIPDVAAAFELIRPNLAMSFPFELDNFQKEGVVLMERGESILVAAHTSAGKTVLAEYAFALSMLHKTKAVYTAPVKAISNQKFRDLGRDFDVGLLTGDVQIKTDSPCLIMTIEILRSMLYRGANLVRDIEWVVFDEVHYLNDDERGIVYEEVIIMLPPHVNIVMLSATVPNRMEFADWVGRTRQTQLHVCGTDRRPVPLSHNLYFYKEIHPICTTSNTAVPPAFDSAAYKRAGLLIQNGGKMPDPNKPKAPLPDGRGGGRGGPNAGGRARGRGAPGGPSAKDLGRSAAQQYRRDQGGRGGGGGGGGGGGMMQSEKQVWTELIYTLRDRDLLPSIMFLFSKKSIDATANALGNIDLTTAEEKNRIRGFIDRSLRRLSEEDRELPQILTMKAFLVRGIGAHHAGCLPIMKEVVEMLFCEGLVRVLFATDTFAMGVNAPARTVAFWHIKKPTGVPGEMRMLRPDEYIQMAGRAGRRGLDKFGTVVVICRNQELPDEGALKQMLTGQSGRIMSKFRLEYRMIVSLLRVRDFKVEDMLRRSFAEFHAQKAHPELQEARIAAIDKLATLRAKPWPDGTDLPSKHDVLEYVRLINEADQLRTELAAACATAPRWRQCIVPGAVAWVAPSPGKPLELAVLVGTVSDLAALFRDQQDNELSAARYRKQGGASTGGKAAYGATGGGAPSKVIALSLHTHHSTDPPPARVADLQTEKGFFSTVKKREWRPPALPRYGGDARGGWALWELPPECVTAFAADARVNSQRPLVLDRLRPLELLESEAEPAFRAALEELRRVGASAELTPVMPGAPPQLHEEYKDVLHHQSSHPVHTLPNKVEAIALLQSELKLQSMIDDFSYMLSNKALHMLPEYAVKLKVLQDTDFVSTDEVVKMKGRVACEISTCECLIATEAVFRGLFTDLEPAEAVALLSTLVNQHKAFSGELFGLTPSLDAALAQLQSMTRELGTLQVAAGLTDVDPDEFVTTSIRPSMVQVVYLWAKGTSFKDICEEAPEGIMEGDIVRTVTRLDQACQDMMSAARVMGNTTLYDQFDQASHAIKRDVIFAGSLYIS